LKDRPQLHMIQIKYTRIILVSPYSNKNIIIVFFIQHTLKEELAPQKNKLRSEDIL